MAIKIPSPEYDALVLGAPMVDAPNGRIRTSLDTRRHSNVVADVWSGALTPHGRDTLSKLFASAPRLQEDNIRLRERVRILREALEVAQSALRRANNYFDDLDDEGLVDECEDAASTVSAALETTKEGD